MLEELKHTDALVKKYRKNTPLVAPTWDISELAINHNDISEESKIAGIVIFEAPFDEVWAGIYEPSVYEKNTLWKTSHDRR